MGKGYHFLGHLEIPLKLLTAKPCTPLRVVFTPPFNWKLCQAQLAPSLSTISPKIVGNLRGQPVYLPLYIHMTALLFV